MGSTAGSGHGLGPHLVGVRVVVRRLVPGETGPSGAPAMTDLLGVCEGYGDGLVVLRPDAGGDPVSIPLAQVVTGKPVPPRGSVRDRVAPADAQRRGFSLFPDLLTEPLGAWVLRDSATATARRANSVLAFGPPGIDLEDAVERVLAHYDRPVAAVLADSAEQAALLARGWVPESAEDGTLFRLAGTARVARALRRVEDDAVSLVEDPPGLVTATLPGASGVAAYDPDSDWLGLRSLHVDPARRRRGLARSLLAALVGWGAERGASTVYLQVLADNAAALALYDSLGFRTHHAYRYLVAPPPLTRR